MTTITPQSPPAAVDGGDGGSPPDGMAPQLKEMELVKRFVSRIATERDAGSPAPDTGLDWDGLWATADGEPSVERAIAKVALRAHSLPAGALGPMPGPNSGSTIRSPDRAVGVEAADLLDRRRQRLITLSSWVRNIGVLMIVFAVWQVWGTSIAQHHDQSTLGHQFAAKFAKRAISSDKPVSLVPSTVLVPDAAEGTVEARLQVPELGIDQYVVAGTAADDLAKGPGHYIGTAMPGQAGNVAIAGHRTTHGGPFNRLNELAVGDPIYLTTAAGQRLTYAVAQTPFPVSPGDVEVLNNFGDDRLTLTTCTPKFSAAQRLVVVAAYLPGGIPSGASAHVRLPVHARDAGTPYRLKNPGSAGWNLAQAPWVLVELVLLVALGLINGRLSGAYGRAGRWVILVPIWAAVIYALLGTLTNFLPAAV